MTAKLKQIWLSINKVLTIINFFLIGVLTLGNIPKKYREKTMPFAMNMVLLLFLVVVIISYTLK